VNIIEALKSGKRARRKSWEPHYGWFMPHFRFDITREDILADDWEIEEKKVTITYGQLEKALYSVNPQCGPITREAIAKELGLIE